MTAAVVCARPFRVTSGWDLCSRPPAHAGPCGVGDLPPLHYKGTTPYFTPAEFAGLMGVHVNTVRKWAREGTIPAMKLGRLTRIPADAITAMAGLKEASHE